MTAGMKRLLVIAYFFPPVGGIGVERTLKYVTYLPDYGWSPSVVSVSNSGYRLVDPASVTRIPPAVRVHRAPSLEPLHLRRVARLLIGAGRTVTSSPDRPGVLPPPDGQEALQRHPRGLRARMNAWWGSAIPLVFFPDDQALWALPAAVAGTVAAHRDRADVIYSSSPPVSAHLAAGIAKTMTGLPWVADFRDPWIGNAFAHQLPGLHRRLQVALEGWIVRGADRVVFATERLRARYVDRYPQLEERFAVIPNGYDPAEVANLGAVTAPAGAEPGAFRLVYAGSVYGDREFGVFLDGVERLLDRRPEVRHRLRVEFFGWLSEVNRELVARRLPALDPVVRHLGQLPRGEALRRVATADAGLVLLADGPDRDLFVGAKAYEYIGLDRQVLAVAPPGELRELLDSLDWGVGVDPSPDGVAQGLEQLLHMAPATHRADPDGRFNRRLLTGRLAAILDEVSTPRDR